MRRRSSSSAKKELEQRVAGLEEEHEAEMRVLRPEQADAGGQAGAAAREAEQRDALRLPIIRRQCAWVHEGLADMLGQDTETVAVVSRSWPLQVVRGRRCVQRPSPRRLGASQPAGQLHCHQPEPNHHRARIRRGAGLCVGTWRVAGACSGDQDRRTRAGEVGWACCAGVQGRRCMTARLARKPLHPRGSG